MSAIVWRMEQQRSAKRVLTVRVSQAGYEHIKDRAEAADIEISHMARRMLTFAALNMPKNWVPAKDER